ncbi:DUF4306 domain-containing protein [Sporosarcina sp. ANT_H38]|uniref:DUF4306 domain-containing protein n=1 Tax=Sporosarcina sp. ANT_H38 TaxID=2597358 RepID=UPI0011F11D19|nr:DUF4306 domain-containing protein [Sporosarcina sp. ANT_H38]KAA0965775.1 DUF4306 domain-containing protein [Sporosarcina sp. ANT_H38]
MKYYIMLIVSGLIFIYNLIASGIVGSYIIDAEDYKKHLIFTDPPFDKSNISDIDKLFYAGKISTHPYFAIISLIFIIIFIVMLIKTNGKRKYSNSNS